MNRMSNRAVVKSAELPPPAGPYSPGIKAGGFIFVSGQIGIDPKTGKVAGDGVKAQTEQVLLNVKSVVEAAGASMSDVVKVTVFLSDISHFKDMNEIYSKFFPNSPPARTTVQASLARKELLVEIDAIAYKP